MKTPSVSASTTCSIPYCLNLKTTAFKDNIVKECKEPFYDKNFANNLDTNFYLLGFNNGIYDLKTSVLRDGRPDDYVSMSTNIDKIDFNPDNEHWVDIKKFIDTKSEVPSMKARDSAIDKINLIGVFLPIMPIKFIS